MPGYQGYHVKKRGWNRSTTIVVVVVHLLALYGLYQLSRTHFLQDLIKVTKLTTMPEPPKPPEPPPSEPAPEPEALPEPTPPEPLPPTVKELPPEPVEPAPAEEPSQAPNSEGEGQEGQEAPATDNAPFAIGKGGSVFSGYEGILTAAIQAAYQQPPDLPDNVDYAVMCQLVLDEDGYVLSYQLLNSSGHPVFDRSAQLALSKLRQVRPPPPGMSRTIVVKFFPP